mmetsp:Transcript_29059/g.62278  ORF Transcript_29059/g.62278 Transcript_29059/m.62278 type:complete len:257 (-) Transcript_29059:486-1256(-)
MKATGIFQSGGFSEHLILVVYNGQQLGGLIFVLDKRKTVVSFFFDGNLGSITGFCRHLVERHVQSIVGVVDTEPSLEGTSHRLKHTLEFSSTGFDLGQTIKNLELDRGGSGVGKGGTTNQGRKVLFGKNEVFDGSIDSIQPVDFLNFDFVCSNVQDALGLVGILVGVCKVSGTIRIKGFDFEGGLGHGALAGTTNKGTEADERCDLVRLVRGIEFHNRVVLRIDTKGGNRLTSVDVKAPNGFSEVSSDTRKERGKV